MGRPNTEHRAPNSGYRTGKGRTRGIPFGIRHTAFTIRRLAFLLCGLVLVAPAPAAEPTCHALLVGGMPGPAVYARRYADWLKRFHAYLTQTAKVPAANVVVLSGDDAFRDPILSGKATRDVIRQTIAGMARRAAPEDQFILVLVGHGTVAETLPSIVLPGQDIHAQELADALATVRSRNQVLLNFTSSAGDAVRFLARGGRVTLAATSPAEVNEPVLAEFFLRGLESKRADGEGTPQAGLLDGTITLLEASNWASYQAAMWTGRMKSTEAGWKVGGKESVEIFQKLYGGPEGEPATRKLSPASDTTAADEPVPLRPKGGLDDFWFGRRIVAEHAVLEDCGQERGVSPLGGDGYRPIAGVKEGEPGALARRVVLGRPGLLPPSGQ